MARRPNYGHDKRRKEQARKDKQEQKRLRKLEEAKERDASAQRPAAEPNVQPAPLD